jgi:hypothetical protein
MWPGIGRLVVCRVERPQVSAMSISLQGSHTQPGNRGLGKRVLITEREQWPITEVVAGYRSQSEVEFSLRQLKDPTWSPSAPCTTGPTTTSASTCVLACRSPTRCAATPTTTACTCRSANCLIPSPASKAVACSPRPPHPGPPRRDLRPGPVGTPHLGHTLNEHQHHP